MQAKDWILPGGAAGALVIVLAVLGWTTARTVQGAEVSTPALPPMHVQAPAKVVTPPTQPTTVEPPATPAKPNASREAASHSSPGTQDGDTPPVKHAEAASPSPTQKPAPASPSTPEASRPTPTSPPPDTARPAQPTPPTTSPQASAPSSSTATPRGDSDGVQMNLDDSAADALLDQGGTLVVLRRDGLYEAAWPDGDVSHIRDVDAFVRRVHGKVLDKDLAAVQDPDPQRRRWLRTRLGDGSVGHIVIPTHLYDRWVAQLPASADQASVGFDGQRFTVEAR